MLVVGTIVAIPAIQNVFDELGTKDTLPAITLWFADFLNKALQCWYIPVIIILGNCRRNYRIYKYSKRKIQF